MHKTLSTLALSCSLLACSEIGGNQDAHGCLPSAGQSYSFLKQRCVQPFDVADIKLPDPTTPMLAVYVILSEDRQLAEVFAADLPENTLLDAVKGGYLSKDNKVRLTRTTSGWKIAK